MEKPVLTSQISVYLRASSKQGSRISGYVGGRALLIHISYLFILSKNMVKQYTGYFVSSKGNGLKG